MSIAILCSVYSFSQHSYTKHQRVQEIKEEADTFRPAEQELEEDVRQRVNPPLAHILIDLIPSPAAGGVVEPCVLRAFVHLLPPLMFCVFASVLIAPSSPIQTVTAT